MVDIYTKGVLTVVAITLVALVVQNEMLHKKLRHVMCGLDSMSPCQIISIAPVQIGGTVAVRPFSVEYDGHLHTFPLEVKIVGP